MPFSKRLCTIITPWGKYEYQHLPMGLCNSPDIFQERMFKLFSDLEFVQAYIYDLLVMSCSTFEEILNILRKFSHGSVMRDLKSMQKNRILLNSKLNI